MIDEILTHLKSKLEPFDINARFSTKRGIYAIGVKCIWECSLNSNQITINPKEIIYIGKTESNQITRDVKTHFESGKTGSSTLRRSLGAILIEKLKLKPIPRSCKERSSKRFTNYKFTSDGEEKLTEWMIVKLSLSYWEYDGSISDLRKIEKEIIKQVCPILNIQNNPENEHKTEIKKLRKYCRDQAEKNKNNCKYFAK